MLKSIVQENTSIKWCFYVFNAGTPPLREKVYSQIVTWESISILKGRTFTVLGTTNSFRDILTKPLECNMPKPGIPIRLGVHFFCKIHPNFLINILKKYYCFPSTHLCFSFFFQCNSGAKFRIFLIAVLLGC